MFFMTKMARFCFMLMQMETKPPTLPEAHALVIVEILKKDKNGYVLEWRWKNISKY